MKQTQNQEIFMRLLVPVDFSKVSDNAVRYAMDFFDLKNTELILYHAYIPFESGFYNPTQGEKENKERHRQLSGMLKTMAQSLEETSKNLTISTYVDKGVETKSILKFSKQKKIDLIIMGTTGASGIKETLVGSVTAKVISEAPCPVIAIPKNYEFKPIDTIVFTTNYKIEDASGIKFLIPIAKRSKAELVIWHFNDGTYEADFEKELTENYKAFVKKTIPYKNISFHFSSTTDIEDALDKLAKKKEIDLLALSTHKRKGFWDKILHKSLAKQIAYHTMVPLLAVPLKMK